MVLACVSACAPTDTPATNAAQQASKPDQGVIIAERPVGISTSGATINGITGSATEPPTGNKTAYEYIVRKPNHDLVSVTQQDTAPLVIGEKVMIITGTQARVVAADKAPPPVKMDTTPRT
jgi:outer membrane lipoprotein SlyB